MALYSLPDMRIRKANPAALKLLGYTEDDIRGKTLYDLAHPDEVEELRAVAKQCMQQGYGEREMRLRRKDGSYVWIAGPAQLVETASGEPLLLGMGRDITERKQQQSKLQEYERAFESAGDMLAAIDEHYCYVLANRAFLQKHDLSRDEVIGHPAPEVLGEEFFSRVKPYVDRCLQTHEPVEFELHYESEHPHTHCVRVCHTPLPQQDGRSRGLVAAIRDVTAECRIGRREETALRMYQAINSARDTKDLAADVVRILREYTGCAAVGIRLESNGRYPLVAAEGIAEVVSTGEQSCPAGAEIGADALCSQLAEGGCWPDAAGQTPRGSVLVRDVQSLNPEQGDAPSAAHICPHWQHLPWRTLALIPLRARGQALGLIHLHDRRPNWVDAGDLRFIEIMADGLAMGLAQQRTQAALKLSEERLRGLLEGVPDIAFKMDARLRTFDFLSPSVDDVLGYRPKELVGLPRESLLELVHPDDRENFSRATNRLLAPEWKGWEEPTLEFRVRHRRGRYVWLSANRRVVRDAEGNPLAMVGMARDITTRKTIEEDIRDAELESAAAAAGSFEGYSIKDTNLRFTYCDEKVAERIGVPPEETIGKTDADFYGDQVGVTWLEKDRDVLRNGKPDIRIYRSVYGERGRSSWEVTKLPLYAPDGEVTGLLTCHRNVAALDRALALVSQWVAVARSSLDAMLSITRDGRVRTWNPGAEHILGYSASEAARLTWADLCAEPREAQMQQAFRKAIGGQVVQNFAGLFKRKDGGLMEGEATLSPILTPAGETAAVSVVMRDVTQQRETQRALQASERRLRTVLETLPGVAYKIDLNTQLLDYVSPRVQRILGYTREELAATRWPQLLRLVAEEDRKRLKSLTEYLLEFRDEQRPEPPIRLRVRHKDGHHVWVSTQRSVLRAEDGHPIAIVGVVNDITERRKIEAQLRESGVDLTGTGTALELRCSLKDADLRFMWVDDQVAEVLGAPPEEVIGKTDFDFYPPELAERFAQRDRQAVQTGEPQVVYEPTLYGNQDERAWQIVSLPLRGADGQVSALLVVQRDTAAQSMADAVLAHWGAVVRSSSDAIMGVSCEGKLLCCNPAFESMYGYVPEEQDGLTLFDLVGPESLADVEQVMKEAANGLTTGSLETVHHTKEGTPIHVDLAVAPIVAPAGGVQALSVIAHDVTAYRQAEAALRRSESRYRVLIENAGEPIFVFDEDGVCRLLNTVAAEYIGGRPEDFIGATVWDFFPAHIAEYQMEGIRRALHEHELVVKETPWVVEDEQRFFRTHLCRTIPSTDGKAQVQLIAHDVTDRKRAEEELLDYRDRLRDLASRLSRVEEKERQRIASDLHDGIGQTLTLAVMKLGVLVDSTRDGAERARLQEVLQLVNQSLDAARTLTFELSPPVLHDLGLGPALEWLAENMQRRHGLKVGFYEDSEARPLDEDARATLFKASREMLFNVIKHADASRVRVSLTREDGSVRVDIEDDGVGFEPEVLSTAWRDTGSFGLFNIRERLTQLGGRLEVKSQTGKGSLLTMFAPLADETQEQLK